MPSVYTIQGATKRRRKRKSAGRTVAQRAAQKRFAEAAQKCKGLPGKKFRSCIARETKRKG